MAAFASLDLVRYVSYGSSAMCVYGGGRVVWFGIGFICSDSPTMCQDPLSRGTRYLGTCH